MPSFQRGGRRDRVRVGYLKGGGDEGELVEAVGGGRGVHGGAARV